MIKPLYVFSAILFRPILFLILIIYLAKELYSYFIVKEGATTSSGIKYVGRNPDGTFNDVTYHDDYTEKADSNAYVVNIGGNVISIPPVGGGTPPMYSKPMQYVYGTASYVPNYEDSVYLSRTANVYKNKPVIETSAIQAGICNYYKNNPDELENACAKTDRNVCASTSCCLLLGGAKCVSGNAEGPIMKSNYSDVSIPNLDYYYYKSKCYGNCPRQ